MAKDTAKEEQMDLWEWLNDLRSPDEEEVPEMPIANWSYGVIQLVNGDLFLAEVYWDKDDLPLVYSEPNLTVDPEEGVQGLIKSLQNAIFDLTEDPHPIPVSAFYTKSK
jgi:hypothetical protein